MAVPEQIVGEFVAEHLTGVRAHGRHAARAGWHRRYQGELGVIFCEVIEQACGYG